MSDDSRTIAQVLRYHSNYYYVDYEGIEYECFAKGILKKEQVEIWVGDYVALDNVDTSHQTARIAQVLDRKTTLAKPKIANVEQAIIVHAIQEPAFDYEQLDRYLSHVIISELQPVICISKCDLAESSETLDQISNLYQGQLGYSVIFTSVHQPETLQGLIQMLQGKTSVLAGLSGAGKSSLMNALNPTLDLKIGDVSQNLGRGTHTTRTVSLIEVLPGVKIADSPGFSHLKFDSVLPEDVEQAFVDFGNYRAGCEFRNCLHIDETGCQVSQNKEAISHSRYKSYLQLVEEAKQYKEHVQSTSQKEHYGKKTIHRQGNQEVQIVKLKQKDRQASRNTQKQKLTASIDSYTDDEDLE